MADIWRNTDLQDLEGEVWKDVVGYEGLYMVSSYGRVKSLGRERKTWEGGIYILKRKILKQSLNRKGYSQVCLRSNSKNGTCTVHRLVAEAFIPNPHNKPQIDHINTNKTDNRVENLRWCTAHENSMNTLTRQHLSEAGKGRKCAWEGVFGKDNPSAISVVQLSLQGEYIRTWDCIMDARRELGIKHISSALKGKRQSAGGFLWIYADKYDSTKKYTYTQKDCKGENSSMWGRLGKDSPFAIPIVQLSLKGEYIKTWDSFSGVQRELGIQQANIHKVLNGQRNHAGGYKWMYLSEYNEGV